MILPRPIFAPILFAWIALAGIAVNPVGAQDLAARNELVTSPLPGPSNATTMTNPAHGHRAPAQPLNPSPGTVWPAEAMRQPNPLWAIPMASLSATRERPIFSSSRRPLPPAQPLVPQVQQLSAQTNRPDHPSLMLLGTVSEGSEGIAVFENEGSKDVIRLRTGESHAGWILKDVKPREVTFLRGSTTAVLDIPSPPASQTPQ
jgi:hypothetical protein